MLRAGGTVEEAISGCESLEKYPALLPTYRCDEAGVRTVQALLKDPAWSLEASEFLRHGSTDAGHLRKTRRGGGLAREHRSLSRRIQAIRQPRLTRCRALNGHRLDREGVLSRPAPQSDAPRRIFGHCSSIDRIHRKDRSHGGS